MDVWGGEVASLVVWSKIGLQISMELADEFCEASLLFSECQHAAFVHNSFCVCENLSSRDRGLIFEFKVRLLRRDDFADL